MAECFACGVSEGVVMVSLKGKQLPACPAHQMLAVKMAPQQGTPTEGASRRALPRKELKQRHQAKQKAEAPDRNHRGKVTRKKIARAALAVVDVAVKRGRLLRVCLPQDVDDAVKTVEATVELIRGRIANEQHIDGFNRSLERIASWLKEGQ